MSGLFPEAYGEEFWKGLDRVRPFVFSDVQRIARADLGAEAAELLVDRPRAARVGFDRAGARGEAARRYEVVIKVQRPGIIARVQADLRSCAGSPIGWRGSRRGARESGGHVDDFTTTLREELDFRREAENLDEFNRIMPDTGPRGSAPRGRITGDTTRKCS